MIRRSIAILALFFFAMPIHAATQVRFALPVPAKLDLAKYRTVVVLPFSTVNHEEGEANERSRGASVDAQKEFNEYFMRILRKETFLKVLESGPVDFPTYDMDVLSRNADFWRAEGERTQADLIVAGSIDFDIQDKSGYRTEDYVSPYDGRTYRRQVLIEQTGFEYDLVLMVFDGKTGERLYADNFKDFKQYQSARATSLQGMFQNLLALENRIANIFTQKAAPAVRTLLGD